MDMYMHNIRTTLPACVREVWNAIEKVEGSN